MPQGLGGEGPDQAGRRSQQDEDLQYVFSNRDNELPLLVPWELDSENMTDMVYSSCRWRIRVNSRRWTWVTEIQASLELRRESLLRD